MADDNQGDTPEAAAATAEADESTRANADPQDKKAAADAVIADRQAKAPQVTRRTVTSRRVTPKGGPAAAKTAKADKDAPAPVESKARDAKKTEAARRGAPAAPPRGATYEKGPSPWWVPAIMFTLLIAGALVIMANYMGVFGDPSNVYLVAGLGAILGGIITATQYR
jgi:hypothetical protein